MGIFLFLICLAFPLLEIAVLVKIGQVIGLWLTLALLIGMAVLGLWVIQRQGWSSFLEARRAMLRGEAPVRPMLDGLLLAVAGALFLAPGFISDVLGLLLVIPPVRRRVGDWLLSHSTIVYGAGGGSGQAHTTAARGDGRGPVIEGEFQRLDERPAHERDDGRGKADPR